MLEIVMYNYYTITILYYIYIIFILFFTTMYWGWLNAQIRPGLRVYVANAN
jgi:hypothetical protein